MSTAIAPELSERDYNYWCTVARSVLDHCQERPLEPEDLVHELWFLILRKIPPGAKKSHYAKFVRLHMWRLIYKSLRPKELSLDAINSEFNHSLRDLTTEHYYHLASELSNLLSSTPLTEKERTVIFETIKGRNGVEISKILNCTRANINAILHSAQEILRRTYNGEVKTPATKITPIIADGSLQAKRVYQRKPYVRQARTAYHFT